MQSSKTLNASRATCLCRTQRSSSEPNQIFHQGVSENPFNFAGKVALVTGGGHGIGRATSLLFAWQGARVVIGDVDPAGVETAETIKRDGGDALFVRTDVREASDVKNLVAVAVKTYGGLHCAFNNAGVLPTEGLLADVEEEAFDQVIAVDLKGVFLSM